MDNNKVIKFVRQKDFVLEKRLGQGATGNTVLLHDTVINERFACKKYAPANPAHAARFFDSFVREIKLLHLINHPNVVRVFNYYLFPEQSTGYILMEYVEGNSIDTHFLLFQEDINEIFTQTINGFAYLEECGILHRDIRESNILITEKNRVKIIDFGFGKHATQSQDYDKSISLNWWCDIPNEFKDSIYDFRTEVYFVGKLFEKIINDFSIEDFEHSDLLGRMCRIEPENRIDSFSAVRKEILAVGFGADFSNTEKELYRDFANSLSGTVISIDEDAKYYSTPSEIIPSLETSYKKVMLETIIPNPSLIASCFINGSYKFTKRYQFSVITLRKFVDMLRNASADKQGIIISNLHARLDAKDRYDTSIDDIPF